MRLDIGRQNQLARIVANLFSFTRRQPRADFGELSIRDADVNSSGAVFNADALDEKIRAFFSHCRGLVVRRVVALSVRAHRRIPFSIALPTK